MREDQEGSTGPGQVYYTGMESSMAQTELADSA